MSYTPILKAKSSLSLIAPHFDSVLYVTAFGPKCYHIYIFKGHPGRVSNIILERSTANPSLSSLYVYIYVYMYMCIYVFLKSAPHAFTVCFFSHTKVAPPKAKLSRISTYWLNFNPPQTKLGDFCLRSVSVSVSVRRSLVTAAHRNRNRQNCGQNMRTIWLDFKHQHREI